MKEQNLKTKLQKAMDDNCPIPEWSIKVSEASKGKQFKIRGKKETGTFLVTVQFNQRKPKGLSKGVDKLCACLLKEEAEKAEKNGTLEHMCRGLITRLAQELNIIETIPDDKDIILGDDGNRNIKPIIMGKENLDLRTILENTFWATCPVHEWSIQVLEARGKSLFEMTGEPCLIGRPPQKAEFLLRIKFNHNVPERFDQDNPEEGVSTPLQRIEVEEVLRKGNLEQYCKSIMTELAQQLNMI